MNVLRAPLVSSLLSTLRDQVTVILPAQPRPAGSSWRFSKLHPHVSKRRVGHALGCGGEARWTAEDPFTSLFPVLELDRNPAWLGTIPLQSGKGPMSKGWFQRLGSDYTLSLPGLQGQATER